FFKKGIYIALLSILTAAWAGCGVYSFTGATIEGKNINFHVLENRARNIVPSLATTLTEKIRNRVLSQTGLTPVNSDEADYDISGSIEAYEVIVTGAQNTQQASQNRLTITVAISFENRKNPQQSFDKSFSRFADINSNVALQSVEGALIETIANQLADDIFNKAFVNW